MGQHCRVKLALSQGPAAEQLFPLRIKLASQPLDKPQGVGAENVVLPCRDRGLDLQPHRLRLRLTHGISLPDGLFSGIF